MAKFLNIKLNEIKLDPKDLAGRLQAQFRFLSSSVPLVKEAALEYLELVQPVVVMKQDLGRSYQYQLVAGHRTFQLIHEFRARSDSCRALVLSNSDPCSTQEFAAMDAVILKVIQRPDGQDLALLATELVDNKALRVEVNKFIPVETQGELAKVLGIERTTLHNMVVRVRKLKEKETGSKKHMGDVHIDLLASEPGEEY